MKRYILCFSLFIITAAMSYSVEPDIIREKFFKTDKIKSLWYYDLFVSGDSLLLAYTGKNTSLPDDEKPRNSGMIVIDNDWVFIDRIEIDRPFDYRIENVSKREGDMLIYYFVSRQPYMMRRNPEGKIVFETDDSEFYNYLYFNDQYTRDSIFICNYEYSSGMYYVDIFNDHLRRIRQISLDVDPIPYELEFYYIPEFLITNDNNFLMIFFGPLQKFGDDKYSTYNVFAKFDRTGKLLWSARIENNNSDLILMSKIVQNKDGDYISMGYVVDSLGENRKFNLVKFDENGEIIWQKIHELEEKTYIYDFTYLENKRQVVVAGTYRTTTKPMKHLFWMSLFDETGEYSASYKWERDENNKIHSLLGLVNGNILVYGSYRDDDLYLAEINTGAVSVKEQPQNNTISLNPNPAGDFTEITFNSGISSKASVEIYDCLGGRVLSKDIGGLVAGQNMVKLWLHNISAGIYFVNVNIEGSIQTQELVKY